MKQTLIIALSLLAFPGWYIINDFIDDGFLPGLSTMLGWVGILGVVGGLFGNTGNTHYSMLNFWMVVVGVVAYYASSKLLSRI